jgi:uncharacterized FAD-dependent dehydrogenase
LRPTELLDITVFRRGYDARKRSNIFFIFTLDVALKDEAAVTQAIEGGQERQPI